MDPRIQKRRSEVALGHDKPEQFFQFDVREFMLMLCHDIDNILRFISEVAKNVQSLLEDG